MIASMRKTFLWIARIFFSLLFIYAGVGKLMNWEGTVNGLVLTFSEWQMHLEGAILKKDVHNMLASSANIIMGVPVGLELIGALLIFLGFKMRIGAAILLLFLIPVTIIMHPFWFNVGTELQRELSVFLKNLSLIGALLYIVLTPSAKRTVQ